VVLTLQRWPGIRGKRPTFWKAFNKQNTRKCSTRARCNQRKSANDSARIRRSTGDSTDYCFRDFDGGSSQETCGGKFVPRLLSQEQKEFRAEVTKALLETANKDPHFPKNFITGDESWAHGYDTKTKTQSSQWK